MLLPWNIANMKDRNSMHELCRSFESTVQFTHFIGRKKMNVLGLSMAAFLTIPLIRQVS